jgi:hypothetical protein
VPHRPERRQRVNRRRWRPGTTIHPPASPTTLKSPSTAWWAVTAARAVDGIQCRLTGGRQAEAIGVDASRLQGRQPPGPPASHPPRRAGRRKAAAEEHLARMGEHLQGPPVHGRRVVLERVAGVAGRAVGPLADADPVVERTGVPVGIRRRQEDVDAEGPHVPFASSRTCAGFVPGPWWGVDPDSHGPPLVEQCANPVGINGASGLGNPQLAVEHHDIEATADRDVHAHHRLGHHGNDCRSPREDKGGDGGQLWVWSLP